MSDISLRDYLDRLTQLVHEGSADEVLWHARHILQYYPKNVEAYRFVGRALVSLGRWDEADATLRRVLSVLPNDKVAHVMLSTVYERKGRRNEAIWHLERAFEQDPNDSYLIGELQRMYREFRQIANPRIQLTTAAVAKQNIRSRDFDRAIEALRASLKRTPQRADLRLLLAEALWQHGDIIDAAETALDVLQTYPESLEANRMLAALWLSEQRPSDARRHLNRVEALDPYLALELVQGHPADKDAFTLSMLDYQRRAQAELLAQQPDWLGSFDTSMSQSEDNPIETDERSGMMARLLGDTPSGIWSTDSESTSAQPAQEPEWMTDLDSIEMNYQINTSTLRAVTSPLAPEEALPDFTAETPTSNDAEQPFAFEWASDTGFLSEASAGSAAQNSEMPDLFTWSEEEEAEAQQLDALNQESDPFSWMNMTPSSSDADDDEMVASDPLAWMRSDGIDIIDGPASAPVLNDTAAFGDPETPPAEDALQWLKDYGIDAAPADSAVSSQNAVDASTRSTEEVQTPFSAEDSEFPMPDLDMMVDDWSERPPTAAWEGPRAPSTMPLTSSPFASPEAGVNDDPLDEWELNERLVNDALGLEALESSSTRPAAPPELSSALPNSEDFQTASERAANSFNLFDQSDRPAQGAPASEDMMTDSKTPEFDWEDEQPESAGDSSSGATGMLNWLNSTDAAQPETAEPASAAADVPDDLLDELDWLTQSENPAYDVPTDQIPSAEDPTGSTGILNWLSQNRPVPPTVPLGQSRVDETYGIDSSFRPPHPDWTDNAPPAQDSPIGDVSSAPAENFDWLYEDQPYEPGQSMAEPPVTPLDTAAPASTDWLTEAADDADARRMPTSALSFELDDDAAFDWLESEELPVDTQPVLPETNVEPELPIAVEGGATEMLEWIGDTEVPPGTLPFDSENTTEEASTPPVEAGATAMLEWIDEAEVPRGTLPFDDETPVETASEPAGAGATAMLNWLEDAEVPPGTTQLEPEPTESIIPPDTRWLNKMYDETAPEEKEPVTTGEIAWDSELDFVPEGQTDTAQVFAPSSSPLDVSAALNDVPEDDNAVEVPPLRASEAGEDSFAALADWLQTDVQDDAPAAEMAQDAEAHDDIPVTPYLEQDLIPTTFSEPTEEEGMLDSGEAQTVPAWLNLGEAASASTDDGQPEENAVEEVFEEEQAESTWLAEGGQSATEEARHPEEAEDEAATPDWLTGAVPVAVATAAAVTPISDAQAEAAPPSPESWNFESIQAQVDNLAFDESEPEQKPPLLETELGEEETTPTPEPVVVDDYFTAFEESGPVYEDMAASSNAPDWLNAMVPGLDIDTTVGIEDSAFGEEEETMETSSSDALTVPQEEFDWLQEIVDEETQPDVAVAASAAQAPRFVFSQLPRWLRRLREGQSAQSVDDDSDLPAWLR